MANDKDLPADNGFLENSNTDANEAAQNAAEQFDKCSYCRNHGPRGKYYCYNWIKDLPEGFNASNLVEVVFKNTRKGYYLNSANLDIKEGDIVAVESNPGHDIGRVSLIGQLVELQLKKSHVKPDTEFKRIFRKARPADMEKFHEATAREHDTMIRARKIAESLGLNMKIGDVEYQGDGQKAIFYYIADERVDFRQLIKVLAETFRVRIEMKQIGARQEAGRIGGIGPCGRPLCCSSWMSNFVSVGTSAARYQDISLNPQKLAGQCAKLKCCLNFEVDTYMEASKFLPERNIRLETADGNTWFHFKTDIFRKEITYSTDKQMAANLVTITAERVFEVIAMNKRGEKPDKLAEEVANENKPKKDFVEIVGQDSLTRFDRAKKKKKKKNKNGGQNQQPQAQGQQPKPQGQKHHAQPQGPNQPPKKEKNDQQRPHKKHNKDANNGQ
ncbi:MAG: hypothetical protein HUK14_02975 [Muribaculaceae bacterium]|nr:hypothetical protein [Muribaculaceae bacterium]